MKKTIQILSVFIGISTIAFVGAAQADTTCNEAVKTALAANSNDQLDEAAAICVKQFNDVPLLSSMYATIVPQCQLVYSTIGAASASELCKMRIAQTVANLPILPGMQND